MEERFEIQYKTTLEGEIKYCFPKSKESKDKNLAICRERGYYIVSCCKLYPFNTMKNQHNFDLIHSICFNMMHDMEIGELEWNDEQYEGLEEMKQKAEKFFCLPLPVAWLPYEEWSDAKELAMMAVNHREQTCIENGRLDLLKYC